MQALQTSLQFNCDEKLEIAVDVQTVDKKKMTQFQALCVIIT